MTLLTIVTGFREGILDGGPSTLMCVAVCAALEPYLRLCGYETHAVAGAVKCKGYYAEHFWLSLDDGSNRIIDPTGDQFPDLNMPPVYIGELPSNYYPHAWAEDFL